MDSSAIFRKKYGSFRRFFLMLGKARLPYLWIAAYLAASVVIANVGVSSTEYSAALFAGNVGLTAVVLPYLFYQLLSLVLGSVSGLLANLCEARMDRNLRRMVWCKTVRLPLRFYETNNPKELLSRITTDISSISGLVMRVFLAVLTTAYSSFVILRKISSYDGALMWSLVAILPVNILISFIMGRLKFGVQDLINRRNAQLTAAIAERTNNLMLIKSMGTEEKEAAVGEGHMRASYRAAGMNIWITGLSLPISAIATALQTVVIILVGRGFYASGALELLGEAVGPLLSAAGIPVETIGLLLVRPVSGSAALGVGAELIETYGPDSLVGRTAAVMLGSTETTFYTIAVYFGAVGITRTRYAVPAALCADLTGFLAAAWAVRVCFG